MTNKHTEALEAARYEMNKSTLRGDKLENAIAAYNKVMQPNHEDMVHLLRRARFFLGCKAGNQSAHNGIEELKADIIAAITQTQEA